MRRWIIPGVIGLLLLAAVGSWGYSQRVANRSLENFLNNKYQRAFFDMTSQVQSLEVLLSKSLVAADPGLDRALLMDIRQQAAFAQSNLGQLPLNDALAGHTAKFLTQVGDYADSLARQVSQGEAIDKHWDTLNSLYQQSMELNRDLQGMQYRVAQNNFYFGEMVRQVRKNLEKTPDNLAQTDFQAMDKRMQRYPTLVYDGPFSEQLERTEPQDLSGQAEVSSTDAQNRALAFIEKKPDVDYRVVVAGTADSRIPAYRVEVNPGGENGGDKTTLDISRQGGKVVWMLNSRPLGDQTMDIDQARQKAQKFLGDRDFGEMRSTYFMRHGNSATFNFAPVQNGVTVYPDQVKVTVALDNGEVTGAEASSYLMSHRQRDLPKAEVSLEQARATINPRLEISGGRLALIPVGVKDEKLAYEFQGKLGEDTYLVYVNAINGREENVLKLIETPGGTLTM